MRKSVSVVDNACALYQMMKTLKPEFEVVVIDPSSGVAESELRKRRSVEHLPNQDSHSSSHGVEYDRGVKFLMGSGICQGLTA